MSQSDWSVVWSASLFAWFQKPPSNPGKSTWFVISWASQRSKLKRLTQISSNNHNSLGMMAEGEGDWGGGWIGWKVGLIWILLVPLGNLPDTEGYTRMATIRDMVDRVRQRSEVKLSWLWMSTVVVRISRVTMSADFLVLLETCRRNRNMLLLSLTSDPPPLPPPVWFDFQIKMKLW